MTAGPLDGIGSASTVSLCRTYQSVAVSELVIPPSRPPMRALGSSGTNTSATEALEVWLGSRKVLMPIINRTPHTAPASQRPIHLTSTRRRNDCIVIMVLIPSMSAASCSSGRQRTVYDSNMTWNALDDIGRNTDSPVNYAERGHYVICAMWIRGCQRERPRPRPPRGRSRPAC
jgi:hypothetical protein